ncbi:MAG: hypothetical protein M3323_12500 [Actinomycetota bacterium]|nr:hypothetical protein [Actinomycetota bacterium]
MLIPIRGADARRRPPPGLDLTALRGGSDDPVVPVVEHGRLLTFTDVEASRRWRPVAQFFTATLDEVPVVAGRLGASEIVQNIAGPVRTRIDLRPSATGDSTRPAVRALAGPLHDEVLDRLRTRFDAAAAVEKVWVAETTVDEHEVLLLGVFVGAGRFDPRSVVRGVARQVVGLLPAGAYEGAQFIVMGKGEVGEAIAAADEPIYVRT